MRPRKKKLGDKLEGIPAGMMFRPDQSHSTHLKISLFGLCFIVLAGIAGYRTIEQWSLMDSLFMTIITLTTVGYGEVQPLSPAGRIFTVVLITLGVGFVAYTIGSLTHWMVETQLRHILGRRRLQKQIERLQGHYIVCGFGRMGTTICDGLKDKKVPVVIIEKEGEVLEKIISSDEYLYIQGDATDDETLLSAGIRRAQGLVAVAASDTTNVYITLTARQLNPELFILSRAEDDSAGRKLKQAGATRVISPYQIGARRMLMAIIRPAVIDFLDAAMFASDIDLQMEEHLVSERSKLSGKSLSESNIRKVHGLSVVAIKRQDGKMLFNPPADTVIENGDKLITIGPLASLEELDRWMH
ncbi:potassium channel family protein [Thermodesulfobacteriota bacterium]